MKRHQKNECGKEANVPCNYPDCKYKGKSKLHLQSHWCNKHGIVLPKRKRNCHGKYLNDL